MARLAQLVEHWSYEPEVTGSNPVSSIIETNSKYSKIIIIFKMFLVIVVRKAKLQQLSHKIANIILNNIIWLIKL